MLRARHDHVVEVFSAQMEHGQPVIRMEYLENGSIADRYGGQPLPVGDALSAVEDACRGLENLHSEGLLHRDLKPANLLIADNGRVKVSDFGLACDESQASRAPVGYLIHLPPEAFPDPRFIESSAGDIYAMGVTLHRMLNGDGVLKHLRGLDDEEVGELVLSGSLVLQTDFAPHVHMGLRSVVRTATHVDPSKRFSSAADMRHAVERVRPKVSWRSVTSGATQTWEGSSRDQKVLWRATLSQRKGAYAFRLEQAKVGKRARTVRSASLDGVSAGDEAYRHVRRVLASVATSGQYRRS
jgi:serine/threonine-protein kinase